MKRGFEYGVLHHLSNIEGSLQDVLVNELALSLDTINNLLELGAIYKDEKRLDGIADLLKINAQKTYFRIHTKPRRFTTQEIVDPVRIVFQNEDFLIFNKPAGVPCHSTVDNNQENLLSVLQKTLKTPLYITHRLDVATSGILLLAKNKTFQKEFNLLLAQRNVRKIYQAITEVPPPAWPNNFELIHYMKPSPRAPKEVTDQKIEGWDECKLKIISLDKSSQKIMIELLTGRTHQIRAQLGFEGFPIKWDFLYGAKEKISDKEQIALKAVNLEFRDYSFTII